MEEEELRGVHYYVGGLGEVEPFAWGEEGGCCVFFSAVVSGWWDDCFLGFWVG